MSSSISRSRTNVRIMAIFTVTARSLFKTDDSIAMPCSVKTYGFFLRPILIPELEVTICDFQFSVSFLSSGNIKSIGKRSRFRWTAWLSALVGTWYSSARSRRAWLSDRVSRRSSARRSRWEKSLVCFCLLFHNSYNREHFSHCQFLFRRF